MGISSRRGVESEEKDHRRYQMKHREVVSGALLVSSGDAAVVLDASDEPLDLVAVLVELAVDPSLGLASAPGGDHRFGSKVGDGREQSVGVVALVAKDRADLLPTGATDRGQKRLGLRAVPSLSGCQRDADRVAERVAEDVDLGREAAPASPEGFGIGGTFF
jgi:hypothetical protein